MNKNEPVLWVPSDKEKMHSNMHHFMDWLSLKKGLPFVDYDTLWLWSVQNPETFWGYIFEYFEIKYSGSWSQAMVKPAVGMIGTSWFPGVFLNYAEHIFTQKNKGRPAIIFASENNTSSTVSWDELEDKVSRVANWLREKGVLRGDRVCSLLPNIPEAVIAFLATNSVGAIWSSCSPDFGNASIEDRFAQIKPKVLFTVDGYTYNGKVFDKTETLNELLPRLTSVQQVVVFPFVFIKRQLPGTVSWDEVLQTQAVELVFERVSFDFPIWILFSSGTTGKPKAITHSVGGCLIEHLKALTLHQDLKPGEKYFWYSTTGWMMWNFAMASMLCGATLMLYEGSAAYPDLRRLWEFAQQEGIHHFGGGAAFYIACLKAGLIFEKNSFPHLRSIGSTGSPLPPEAFEWIYANVKDNVWLISLSGGTDICSCFVGGNPLLPVYSGEIQCRLLGCSLDAWDETGKSIREQLGEMVITEPMPSMPVYFWDDEDNKRYHSSYFKHFPGIWRHGDWISITKRNTIIIYGRSDATLNRDGVRIGTSEVYSAVESMQEISDSLMVCIELSGGKYFMPLFVVLKDGLILTDELRKNINLQLKTKYSPRHVPDAIFQISQVPYTISGKKMEAPVKKILMGMEPDSAASRDTMKNPGAMEQFVAFRPPL